MILKACPNVRRLMKSHTHTLGRLTIARVRCKQWTCEFCAKRNMNAWRRHLIERLQGPLAEKSWCFVTLTAPPELHGYPEKSVAMFQEAWKRLYDLFRRYLNEKLSYIYMYEAHKSGTYHMHSLMSCGRAYDKSPLCYVWKKPLEQHPLHRWLQDTLPHLGAGWRVDIRRVYSVYGLSDGVSAVLYSLKYLAKAKDWARFKKHARRIGVTQDIGGLPKPPKSEHAWKLVPWIKIEDFKLETEVFDLTVKKRVHEADFENGYYPPENSEE